MTRRVTFEARADGRAEPVEHIDLPPRPAGGASYRVRRPSRRRVPDWLLRGAAVVLSALALDVAVNVVVEAVPPSLPYVLLFLCGSIALLGENLSAFLSDHARLRAELRLAARQREEGRRRIRQLESWGAAAPHVGPSAGGAR